MRWPAHAAARWFFYFLCGAAFFAALHAGIWLVTGEPSLHSALGLASTGLFAATVLLCLGLSLLQFLLRIEGAPLGVARTVLHEAFRKRVAAGSVTVLLVSLSMLPWVLGRGAPLHYRIQTFLSFGLDLTGLLLSLTTIFLACGTLSGEVEDKRIFTVMAKPIGRGAYLAGKWLGLVLLNGLLLGVAGATLYGFTWLLARQPAQDQEDRKKVEQEVLTARADVQPRPPEPFEARARREYEELKKQGFAFAKDESEAEILEDLIEKAQREWRSIGPHGRETYVFAGLGEAKEQGASLQFRYLLRASPMPPDGELPLSLLVNGRPAPKTLKTGQFEVLRVPPEALGTDGLLTLVVINENPADPGKGFETTLTFPPGDGLEILYRAGGFEMNLVRGLGIVWVRLAFLAVLGLFAASFLGYSVAALLALVVYVVASSSGFLLESLAFYSQNAPSEGFKSATSLGRTLSVALAQLLGPFSRFAPTPRVVDGRLVPWNEVLACAGWLGLLWCGLTGLLAWLIFRVRELGRVQV